VRERKINSSGQKRVGPGVCWEKTRPDREHDDQQTSKRDWNIVSSIRMKSTLPLSLSLPLPLSSNHQGRPVNVRPDPLAGKVERQHTVDQGRRAFDKARDQPTTKSGDIRMGWSRRMRRGGGMRIRPDVTRCQAVRFWGTTTDNFPRFIKEGHPDHSTIRTSVGGMSRHSPRLGR
jgi:hypothetical protein